MFHQWCKECGNKHGPFNSSCEKCGCTELLMQPPKVTIASSQQYKGEGSKYDAGVQVRYEQRKRLVSKPSFIFWWAVHNSIAHPAIAFFPFKPLFDFHDYTARKIGSELLNEEAISTKETFR